MTTVTKQRQDWDLRALAPKLALFGCLVVEQMYENREMRVHFEAVLMTSGVIRIQWKAVAAPLRCTDIFLSVKFPFQTPVAQPSPDRLSLVFRPPAIAT